MHFLQGGDLGLDFGQVLAGDGLDVGAGATAIFVKRQQGAAVPDTEAKRAGATQKRQLVEIAGAEGAVAIAPAQGLDQADILVIADGLGGQARAQRDFTDVHGALVAVVAGRKRRRRRALLSTVTLEIAIAPAASIGDSRVPFSG